MPDAIARPLAALGALAAVIVLCLPAAQAANDRHGRITRADIGNFNRLEQQADTANEALGQSIAAYAKACEGMKRSPAALQGPYKTAALALVQTAAKQEGTWAALDTAAAALDRRSHAYSNAKIAAIVGTASDTLSYGFFKRKTGTEALKLAAERLARLNCSIDDQIAEYKRERQFEQEEFPKSMKHLEFALDHEP